MLLRMLFTILIGCCFINFACSPEKSLQPEASAKDGILIPTVPIIDRPEVPIVPIVPLAPVPGPGFGGGSQGAIEPAKTGNADEPKKRDEGPCGNGIQEAQGKVLGCPFDIYGTAFDQLNNQSFLVGFNINAGGEASSSVGITYSALGCDVRDITAIEFAPDGTLYAVGTLACGEPNDLLITTKLFTLDCVTAVANLVGDTQIESLFTGMNPDTAIITDLDFDSQGKLYAYVRALGDNNSDQLGMINVGTGLYTNIGSPNISEMGSGLATIDFPDPTVLFQAGVMLRGLDIGDGTVQSTISINFPVDSLSPRVRGMDRDPLKDKIYVNLQIGGTELNPDESYLAILTFGDPAIVNYLKPISPEAAPQDLRGITVNLTNEECDSNGIELPDGTICSENCELLEDRCNDYELEEPYAFIDNDFDGLPNCEDPDCLNKTCDDQNACTEGETCQDFSCEENVPAAKCRDNNECSIDTCIPIDVASFTEFGCSYSLPDNTDYGSCTPSGNCDGPLNSDGICPPASILDLCLVGRCNIDIVQGNTLFVCEEIDRAALPLGDPSGLGCDGDTECIEYTCVDEVVDNIRAARCAEEFFGSSTTCNAGNVCGTGNCDGAGGCNSTNRVTHCDENADCLSGPCINQVCTCDDGNDCTEEGVCIDGYCQNVSLVFCDDNDDCGVGSQCFEGLCTCFEDINCPVGSECRLDFNRCVIVGVEFNTPENTPCEGDGVDCTADECDGAGSCISEQNDASCGTNNLCLNAMCTETGCKNEVLDGTISCQIVDGNDCTLGTIECLNGTEDDDGCEPLSPSTPCALRILNGATASK